MRSPCGPIAGFMPRWVGRRIEELLHIRVHALATVAEAHHLEAMHVLVDLPLADGEQLLVAEVDLAGAAADQDRERLGRLAAAGEAGLGGAEQALLAIEVMV